MTPAPYCQGADWKPRRSATEPGTCGACGKPLPEGRNWFCRSKPHDDASCRLRYLRNHGWAFSRREALRRSGGRCVWCGARAEEVNHIEPRRGRGYRMGCWNHQEGLEPLCHQCHLIITTAQRRGQAVPHTHIEIRPTLLGAIVKRC